MTMRPLLSRAWRFVGSMSFAVGILCVVALASSMGTFVGQGQPWARDVEDFGLLWARVHQALGLDDVYHAPWFLGLLAFLALSTGRCVWRHAPRMLSEFISLREDMAARQLERLKIRHVVASPWPSAPDVARLHDELRRLGYRVRVRAGTTGRTDVSAGKGLSRRLGYLLTHLAVVVLAVGGLADGNPWQLAQRAAGRLVVQPLDRPPSQAPRSARVPVDGGSFRGALRLAPGERARTAVLSAGDGYLLRDLPVEVGLKDFHVEYHPSGQPKDFVSEIVVGEPGAASGGRLVRVSVNHPAQAGGLTFHQSGFEDGGSSIHLETVTPDDSPPASLVLRVGESRPLLVDGRPLQVEARDFHPRNVVADRPEGARSWKATFLDGARAPVRTDLGPSVDVVLRDDAGQGLEATLYQHPVELDGRRYIVSEWRAPADRATRLVRLPVDPDGSLTTYRALLAALRPPAARRGLLRGFVGGLADEAHATLVKESLDSAFQVFFDGGFAALEKRVPDEAARRAIVGLMSRAASFALRRTSSMDDATAVAFVADALLGHDQWIRAGRPAVARVTGVEMRWATVLQVSQSPGAFAVVGGMAMLAFGVALMVLVPERRVWLRHTAQGGAVLAMSPHRTTAEAQAEFGRLVEAMAAPTAATAKEKWT